MLEATHQNRARLRCRRARRAPRVRRRGHKVMIKVEVVWEALDRPDTGVLSSRIFNTEAGETVEYYATRIYHGNMFDGYGIPRIVAWEHVDGDGAVAPLALDDVVAYSSRLILRARIPEADTHLMFMYQADGSPYVPVGGMSFADKEAVATLELDSYDCAMVLAKRLLSNISRGEEDEESIREAARRLLKSKPPFEDLKVSAASAYSTKQPTSKDLLPEFYQNRNSRIPVDPSAKVSESLELLRGRRRCHIIFLLRARSADDPSAKPTPPRGASEELPAAKPTPPRGASEELPAVKPKGIRAPFIIFCDKQRPALEKKGMSLREIGVPTASKDRIFFSRAKPPFSPQAENAASSGPS